MLQIPHYEGQNKDLEMWHFELQLLKIKLKRCRMFTVDSKVEDVMSDPDATEDMGITVDWGIKGRLLTLTLIILTILRLDS